jgi:DMSO/TMAO reductase YedYZ molybdopterin-dependent catalytic subunit
MTANRNELRLPRRALIGGLATLGGLTLAGCSEENPPTYGNVLRIGDDFTYRAQRMLLPRNVLVRQFEHADITSMPAIGTTNPGSAKEPAFSVDHGETYDRLQHTAFADWRLDVAGLVARPRAFSLADLKALPARTQITRHTCEEGWSSIAEWTGTPLAALLSAVGMAPNARYVNFHAYDEIVDSIDLMDALHPQTILAYGMNGGDLPRGHGAPLRLRVETQMGYKSVKFLRRIEVVEKFDDFGKKGDIQNGWAWYAGI